MLKDHLTARKTARYLLEIGAIRLNLKNPFTWASGWTSPIYCDNRLTLSYPDIRKFIKKSLASLVKSVFSEAEAVAGVATAGIPQGAMVADKLNLPFIYVRAKAKDHGLGNQIEGKVDKGMKVVVVEDLVSTGTSSLHVVESLREGQVEVLGMAAIFTYGFQTAEENFNSANVRLYTLCDYSVLIQEALRMGNINENDLILLKSWRTDPSHWKP